MSIEALLTSLKEALDANTEALNRVAASGGATTTTKENAGETAPKGRSRPSKDAAETTKITQDMVNAALIKIKDEFGMEHAKTVIKEAGGVDKMAEIKPAKFQAVYEAAVAKYEELSNEGGGGAEEGGL